MFGSWKSKNPAKRRRAVERMDPASERLVRMALEDEDGAVRSAAIGRMAGQQDLEHVARVGKSAQDRMAALRRVSDPAVIWALCQSSQVAIGMIEDKDFLRGIAHTHGDYEVRASALRKLGESELANLEIALHAPGDRASDAVRWLMEAKHREAVLRGADAWEAQVAAAQASSVEVLERVALDHPLPAVRKVAVAKGGLLLSVVRKAAQEDPDEGVRLAAAMRLEDLDPKLRNQRALERYAAETDGEKRMAWLDRLDDRATLVQAATLCPPQAMTQREARRFADALGEGALIELFICRPGYERHHQVFAPKISQARLAANYHHLAQDVRPIVVQGMRDPDKLKAIVEGGDDEPVRLTALTSLFFARQRGRKANSAQSRAEWNQFYISIAAKDPSAAVRHAAMENIQGDQALAAFAREVDDDGLRGAALARIQKEAVLAALASEAGDVRVRMKAARLLRSSDAIRDTAMVMDDPDILEVLLKNLKQPAALLAVLGGRELTLCQLGTIEKNLMAYAKQTGDYRPEAQVLTRIFLHADHAGSWGHYASLKAVAMAAPQLLLPHWDEFSRCLASLHSDYREQGTHTDYKRYKSFVGSSDCHDDAGVHTDTGQWHYVNTHGMALTEILPHIARAKGR